MAACRSNWVNTKQAAIELDSTCAEICRLLSVGRLKGKKHKQPGRPGTGQWLIDPRSVAKERRLAARAAAKNPDRKRPRPPL